MRPWGIVNLFVLRQYQGQGEAISPLYSLRRPELESGSPARPGIVAVALADRRARETEADADGNVGRWDRKARENVERGREI